MSSFAIHLYSLLLLRLWILSQITRVGQYENKHSFSHSHLSWSWIIPYLLPPSINHAINCLKFLTIKKVLIVKISIEVTHSVLWCCWLGSRKGIRPVKKWVVGCWHGCLGRGADLHMTQLMPLPLTVSCSSKSRLVLPFWYRLTRVVPDEVQGTIK